MAAYSDANPQVAVHASELPEAGSYRVHELGKESLLFVRGEDDRIRRIFNVSTAATSRAILRSARACSNAPFTAGNGI